MCKEVQATESDSYRKYNFYVSLVSTVSFAGVLIIFPWLEQRGEQKVSQRECCLSVSLLEKTNPLGGLADTVHNMEGTLKLRFLSFWFPFCCDFLLFSSFCWVLLRFLVFRCFYFCVFLCFFFFFSVLLRFVVFCSVLFIAFCVLLCYFRYATFHCACICVLSCFVAFCRCVMFSRFVAFCSLVYM